MNRETVFSEDRLYRYTLWRQWPDLLSEHPESYAMWIGLNPSTADEVQDDPTIRRCIDFTKRWGLSAMCMTNLFAFRATDPKVMRQQIDPIGTENDNWLIKIAEKANVIIAAWGTHGEFLGRGLKVSAWLEEHQYRLFCLRKSKEGFPVHPLYIPANTKPIRLM